MKTIKLVLVILFSIAIASCKGGGSGGGGTTPVAKVSLSGTVAVSSPTTLSNVPITIRDTTGNTASSATLSNGKYSVDVTGMKAPFLVKVPYENGYLYSVATDAGIANVHPFTDLIIRNWYKVKGGDVETAFSAAGSLTIIPTLAEINTIELVIRNVLSTWMTTEGLTASTFNLINSAFNSDNTGFDKVLDNTGVVIGSTGNVTVTTADPTTGIKSTMVATTITTNLTTADTTKPTDPAGLVALPASTTSIVLVWNASNDNVGVAGYNIYRDTTKVGTSPYPVYIDTGLTPANHCYQVVAYDGAGNMSAKAPATLACNTPVADTIAPTAPTGLTATAASASQINLSWTASTDNVGVAGYAIYRNGIKVAAVNGTSYSDTGLSSGTLYAYTVNAMDGALNLSAASNTAPATTQAGIPSAPTGVTATAGNGQATISWTAVGGASSYNLYMATQSGVTKSNYAALTGGMKHLSVTSPYVHTGLSNGTAYYFIVTAVNVSGESVESAQVSATPAAASVSQFNGTYAASSAGTQGGAVGPIGTFTVTNGVVTGTINVFSGTVSASGAITASATSTTGCDATFTGQISLTASGGATAAGTFVFIGLDRPTGGPCNGGAAWTATRINISAKFPIAATANRESSWDAAFDGTNYLVGLQAGSTTLTHVGAQLVSQSGALVGSIASTTRVGDPPFVSFDGTNYLLVWRDHTNDPTDAGIWGQLVSTGGALVSTPFKIASGDLTLSARSIIFDGNNYFVVWNTGSSGDLIDLYGQFISPTGSLVGSAIAVSTAAHQQRDFAIGFDGTRILVVFVDGQRYNSLGINPCGGNLYLPTDISGQFVTKSTAGTAGALSGANFVINQDAFPSDNGPPTIAFDGTNYLVIWHDQTTLPNICVAGNPEGGAGSVNLNGQLVGSTGVLSGGVIAISSAAGSQFMPALAFDGTNYLVTWTDARNDVNNNFICDAGEGTCVDIYGQYIGKSGGRVGGEFVINADPGNQVQPFMLFAAGKYFVGWSGRSIAGAGTSDDVYGAFITP